MADPYADRPAGLGSHGSVEVEALTKVTDSLEGTSNRVVAEGVGADRWAIAVLEDRARRRTATVSIESAEQCLADLTEVVDRRFLKRLFVSIAEHLGQTR